jgi:LmbE family N-acetylglucosaminyl deacetylase
VKFANKRVLVLAPHCDDEIWCTGTLLRAHGEGAQIRIVACSSCTELFPDDPGVLRREFMRSCRALDAEPAVMEWPVRRLDEHRQDILEAFVKIRDDYGPQIVLCPSSTDSHQDHDVVHAEAVRAFRDIELLLGYECPHNQRTATLDAFVAMPQMALEAKVNLWKGYKSQQYREFYDEEFIRSLAVVRGKQCKSVTGFAEAFEVIRLFLP